MTLTILIPLRRKKKGIIQGSFVPNNTKNLKIFNLKSNLVYASQGLIDYLVPSYQIKLTMVGGGVAAVYFLSIQSKRFVALMNEIVAL